ncbi:MAG: hypothetical protein DMG06_05025 [Acidobacteria bacterium]|nr:MAG: hypothetical protein DMG06_05025 [Acidobacteriota bacterium]
MVISRRTFLGNAAVCSAALLSASRGWSSFSWRPRQDLDCLIVDLQDHCSLQESIRGYESALETAGVGFIRALPQVTLKCRNVIVPGMAQIDESLGRELLNCLENGSSLLLECGLGFVDSSIFEAQQNFLRSHFDLGIQSPVHLLTRQDHHYVPYINYSWPLELSVREFGPVVPLSDHGASWIGWAQELPVALRQKIGRGMLTFLGSPLGPALLAGDLHARQWLYKLLTSGHRRER